MLGEPNLYYLVMKNKLSHHIFRGWGRTKFTSIKFKSNITFCGVRELPTFPNNLPDVIKGRPLYWTFGSKRLTEQNETQYHNIKIGYKFFEEVEHFRHLGKSPTNKASFLKKLGADWTQGMLVIIR
jgi:hypothetical protein